METDPFRDAASRMLGLACAISGWAGALILLGIATTTVVSVVGRALFDSPIMGDVETVQFAIAVSIAACLPYAQFQKANIIVDFFTTSASRRSQSRMDAFGVLLYGLVMALVTWRVAAGSYTTWHNGEVSMLLSLPVWASYAAMVPSLALACVVGFWQFVRLLRPPESEAGDGA